MSGHLAELAQHYRLAGDIEKTIDFSIRAGEAALAIFAAEEASAQWQAALELLERQGHSERAHICYRLSEVTFRFDFAKSLDNSEKALRLFQRLGQPKWSGLAHSRIGSILGIPSGHANLPRAMEHFRQANSCLAHSKAEDTTAIAASIDAGIADTAAHTFEIREGLAAAHRAIQAAASLGGDSLAAYSACRLGNLLCRAGRVAEAFAQFQQAWETADRGRSVATHAAVWNLADWYNLFHEPDSARFWCELGLSRPWSTAGTWRAIL